MTNKVTNKSLWFCLLCLWSIVVHANEVELIKPYSLKYSAETHVPESRIWQLWSNVKQWKVFDERLETSYLIDGQPFGLGAEGYIKTKGGVKTRFKIIAFDDQVSFVEKLYLPLYQSIELKRYFERTPEGHTVFVHEVNFKGRLRSVMYWVLCRAFKKDLKLVVDRLKVVAERE